MPALPNPKHEAFAIALAKGKTADEAYEIAGYSPHRQNAHRLMTKDDVRARVSELQTQIAERTIERSVLSKEWVIKRLQENDEAAFAAGKFEASTAALKLIGSELWSMFVTKSEQGSPGDFSRYSDEELDRFIAERSGERLTATSKTVGKA